MISSECLEIVLENGVLAFFAPLNATVRNISHVVKQDDPAKTALQRNNNVESISWYCAIVVAREKVCAVRIDDQIRVSILTLKMPIHYDRPVACGRLSYARSLC